MGEISKSDAQGEDGRGPGSAKEGHPRRIHPGGVEPRSNTSSSLLKRGGLVTLRIYASL